MKAKTQMRLWGPKRSFQLPPTREITCDWTPRLSLRASMHRPLILACCLFSLVDALVRWALLFGSKRVKKFVPTRGEYFDQVS